MKKIILIILIFVSLFSCKKIMFDYRNKYIGNYYFTVEYSSWDPINGQHDSLYFIDGKVDYGYNDNTILIKFNDGSYKENFVIYEDGTIEGKCNGEFESGNILKYSCYQVSPASHSYIIINGKKNE